MLLEIEVVELKAVTSRVSRPPLIVIVLIDQLNIIVDAIVKRAVDLCAVDVVVKKISFLVARP